MNNIVFQPATGAENAIFPPHIHTTREEPFTPALKSSFLAAFPTGASRQAHGKLPGYEVSRIEAFFRPEARENWEGWL